MAYAAIAASFATPWMAKEAGLFEKYGLDVELTYVPSGPTLLQAMLAGELDFGEIGAPSSMNAYLEGGEIVWIAGAVNRPVTFIIAKPEIARVEDLRGRPVGVTRIGTTSHTFMKLALRSGGLDPDRDVEVLQTGGLPETLRALVNGRIDAGVSGSPFHLMAQHEGMHILVDVAQLGIPWPLGGAIATRSAIAAHSERVRNYLKAYVEALHLLRTDRERSVAVVSKYTDTPDRTLAEPTWEIMLPHYAMPPYPDRVAMETVIREELIAANPKARDVPADAYYDDRFVRELDESGFVRQITGG